MLSNDSLDEDDPIGLYIVELDDEEIPAKIDDVEPDDMPEEIAARLQQSTIPTSTVTSPIPTLSADFQDAVVISDDSAPEAATTSATTSTTSTKRRTKATSTVAILLDG